MLTNGSICSKKENKYVLSNKPNIAAQSLFPSYFLFLLTKIDLIDFLEPGVI